jgi:phage N-6-adenine-methyltransferase
MTTSSLMPQTQVVPRLSQKSYEWYTPARYITLVREVLGTIALDPASCEMANQVIQADWYYDRQTAGLKQSWEAETVFLNPPYCKTGSVSNQELWTRKLVVEYEAGHVKEAILLVNAATETLWFQRLYQYPICFVKGRIQFTSPQGSKNSSTVGSAFVYFGTNTEQFIRVFQSIGTIVRCVLSVEGKTRMACCF